MLRKWTKFSCTHSRVNKTLKDAPKETTLKKKLSKNTNFSVPTTVVTEFRNKQLQRACSSTADQVSNDRLQITTPAAQQTDTTAADAEPPQPLSTEYAAERCSELGALLAKQCVEKKMNTEEFDIIIDTLNKRIGKAKHRGETAEQHYVHIYLPSYVRR